MTVPNIDSTLEMSEFKQVVDEMELDRLMAEFERVMREMVVTRLEPKFAFEQPKPLQESFNSDDIDSDVPEIDDEFQQLEKAIKYLSMKHKSVQTDDVVIADGDRCCHCGLLKTEIEEGAEEVTSPVTAEEEATSTEQTDYDHSLSSVLTSEGDTDCDPDELDSDELAKSDFLEDNGFNQTDWDDDS